MNKNINKITEIVNDWLREKHFDNYLKDSDNLRVSADYRKYFIAFLPCKYVGDDRDKPIIFEITRRQMLAFTNTNMLERHIALILNDKHFIGWLDFQGG